MSYAEYMKTEVFKPLDMHNTYVDSKNLMLDKRVQGYEKKGACIVPINRVTEWIMGGADIVSCVDDVYCLNKAIKNKLLVSEESWKEILTPSPINSMGFGCTVTNWHNMKRITHNGGWEGFRTMHLQLPKEDFDVILLSNSAWGDARNDIAEAIYRAYFGYDTNIGDEIKMDMGYIK